MITGTQCAAARALLGWRQSDLSDAIAVAGGKLSVTAITAFERGGAIRDSNAHAITSALEAAGVQFLEAGQASGGVGVVLTKNDKTPAS